MASNMAQLESSREQQASLALSQQKRTYTIWCNVHLKQRSLEINELFEDLKDGVRLINLMEVISGFTLDFGKWNKTPKLKVHFQENLNKALAAMRTEGIRLVNIGCDDIIAGDNKLTLGLIWMLILRYQIQDGLDGVEDGGVKAALLRWVKAMIKDDYPDVPIPTNFTSGFQDGRVFAALVHKIKPVYDYKGEVSPSKPVDNCELAFSTADRELSVPRLLLPQEVVSTPEENSIMTYVSFLQKAHDQAKQRGNIKAAAFVLAGPVRAVAGVPTELTITSKKPNDGATADMFKAAIVTPSGAAYPLHVNAERVNHNTTLVVPFVPVSTGVNKGRAVVNDQDVQHSPCSVSVEPGPTCDRASQASGDGYTNAISMLESNFTIHARDTCGNPKTTGGDKFVVEIKSGGETAAGVVKDNGDGTYAVTYRAPKAGKGEIVIALVLPEAQHAAQVAQRQAAAGILKGADVSHPVLLPDPAAAASAAPTTPRARSTSKDALAAPAPVRPAPAHAPAHAPVQTPTEKTAAQWEAELRGSLPADATMCAGCHKACTDTEDRFEALGRQWHVGHLNCFKCKKNLESESFREAHGWPSCPECYVSVFAPKCAGCHKGIAAEAVTVAGQQYHPACFVCVGCGKDFPDGKVVLKDGHPYHRDCSTLPPKFGAAHASEPAPAPAPAPATVHAPAPAAVAAPRPAPAPAAPATPRSAPVSAPPAALAEVIALLEQPSQVYRHEAGNVLVLVGPSPSVLDVAPGPDAAHSTVTGEGTQHAVAGVPSTVVLQTRDHTGKAVPKGGVAGAIAVAMTGPSGKAALEKPAEIKDNGDGTYSITYVPTESGPNALAITLGGAPVGGAPLTVNVDAGAADPSKCFAEGPGVRGAAVKAPAKFKIHAVDKFGNKATRGGEKFEAALAGPSAAAAVVQDNGDGTYSAQYLPTASGPHTLAVALVDPAGKKTNIKESPFTVPVATVDELLLQNKNLSDALTEIRKHRDGLVKEIDSKDGPATCNCGVPNTVDCPSCHTQFNAHEWLKKKFGDYLKW